jgi:hypothetical protein
VLFDRNTVLVEAEARRSPAFGTRPPPRLERPAPASMLGKARPERRTDERADRGAGIRSQSDRQARVPER